MKSPNNAKLRTARLSLLLSHSQSPRRTPPVADLEGIRRLHTSFMKRYFIIILILAITPRLHAKNEAGSRADNGLPSRAEERRAEETRKAAEQQRVREAQTIEAAKQEALKIIEEGSRVRQEKQDIERREQDLTNRLSSFDRTDALMKTGIFGVIATVIVGIAAIIINYFNGRAQRRLHRLEVLEKEHKLRTKKIIT